MKANEAPKKIFVNPNALQNSGYNGKDYMFIHDSVFDESKCIIEYVRTDAFIEKACEYLQKNMWRIVCEENEFRQRFVTDFKNYMKGE